MTFIAVNRKTVRKAWASRLATNIAGSGKPAQVVYDYQKADFDAVVPAGTEVPDTRVVVVTSDGTEGDPLLTGAAASVFLLTHIFVLYARGSWTEENSEDAIDDISQAVISQAILDADRREEDEPEWLRITEMQRSEVDSVMIEGLEYRHEAIALTFDVGNSA